MRWFESMQGKEKVDWWCLGFWVAIIVGSGLFWTAAIYGAYSYLNKCDPETKQIALVGQRVSQGCLHDAQLNMMGVYGIRESQHIITSLELKLEEKEKEVIRLESMIKADDRLLYHFTHETWDRSCEYQIQAGIILADGSVKSSVVQFCD